MAGTPVCTIDAFGIHRPTFGDVLAWAEAAFRAIYGQDVYLGADSQDGEWIGLFATAIDDSNAMCVQAYNAFSPTTAQGVGLSSVVKINGLARLVPSFSTAPILVGGQAGRPVVAGLLGDDNNNTWALPPSVVIPYSGQIVVSATCTTPGAVAAPAGTISTLLNPQPGWQTATSTEDATLGAPLEVDATLRYRQNLSTMNSATALLEGLVGAILALPGVARCQGYQNTGDVVDANGLPGNSIAIVVDGGLALPIINLIWQKKGGCGTYGSVTSTIIDAYGVPLPISYFPVVLDQITVAITIKQLQAFDFNVVAQIQQTVSDKINANGIGNNVQFNRLYAAAYLFGGVGSATYEIVSIAVGANSMTPTSADILIAFNHAASCVPANVVVTVQPY